MKNCCSATTFMHEGGLFGLACMIEAPEVTFSANMFLAPCPRGVATLVPEDKIQITLVILGQDALSMNILHSTFLVEEH